MRLRPAYCPPCRGCILQLVCFRRAPRPLLVLRLRPGPPHPSASPGRLRPPPSAPSSRGLVRACRPAWSFSPAWSLGRRPSHRSRRVFAGRRRIRIPPLFALCAKRSGCSLRRLPRSRHRGVPFLALRLRTALIVRHTAVRSLDCRGGITAAAALSRLTSPPTKFPPQAVVGGSPFVGAGGRRLSEGRGSHAAAHSPAVTAPAGAKGAPPGRGWRANRRQAPSSPAAGPHCPLGAGLREGPQPAAAVCAPAGGGTGLFQRMFSPGRAGKTPNGWAAGAGA